MLPRPNKLIMLLYLLLLASIQLYSQTTILNKKDTLVCFSVPQSKYLLKKYHEAATFRQLNSVCERQLFFSDSVVAAEKEIILNQSLIIKNKDEVVSLKDYEITNLKEQLKSQVRKTNTQKVYKVIAITAGLFTAGFLGYYIIAH